jgi:ribosomal protein L5
LVWAGQRRQTSHRSCHQYRTQDHWPATVETVAKNSIAGFKLREGNKIGLKVTLRGDKMYEFVDRVITLVLPRLRDFHGVSDKAFDKQGNYSLGFVDQSVFPELSFDETPGPWITSRFCN